MPTSDSLLNAQPDEIRYVAEQFAAAFGVKSEGSSAGAGKETDPLKRKMRKEEEENFRLMKEETKSRKALNVAVGGLTKFIQDQTRGANIGDIWNKAMENARSNLESGMQSGINLQQRWAEVMLGTRIKELNQLNQETRLTTISMGGYHAWTDKLIGQHKHYFMKTGDAVKATKVMAQNLNLLSEAGIVPTFEALQKGDDTQGRYGQAIEESMGHLRTLGITYEQSSDLLKTSIEDENVRTRLRGVTSDKERQAIIRGIFRRNQEFRMMGMNVEQMKKANSALEAIAGKGPIERYKQAAKAQAMLTAMGVENADAIADFIRQGGRVSDETMGAATRGLAQFNEIQAQARQAGFGEEVPIALMAQQSGMIETAKQIEGTLTKPRAVDEETLLAMTTVGDSSQSTADAVMSHTAYFDNILQNARQNSDVVMALEMGVNKILQFLIKGAGGGAGAMGAGALGGLLLGKGKGLLGGAKNVLGSIFGKAKGGLGAMSNLKNIAGFGSKALKLGKSATPWGLAALSAETVAETALTGDNMLHRMMGTNASDMYGGAINQVGAWFGSEEAQNNIKMREQLEAQNAKDAEHQRKKQEKMSQQERLLESRKARLALQREQLSNPEKWGQEQLNAMKSQLTKQDDLIAAVKEQTTSINTMSEFFTGGRYNSTGPDGQPSATDPTGSNQ